MDKESMSSDLRWDNYSIKKGDLEILPFFKNHFQNSNRKVLFILGLGFDIRMNIAIEKLINNSLNIEIKCLLIEYDEGKSSISNNYRPSVEINFNKLNKLLGNKIEHKKIKLWNGQGRRKRRVGDRNVTEIINSYSDISNYTDIVVDISALPRGIYFSLIGKLLFLIDSERKENREMHNLFIITSENAKIDALTLEEVPDEDLNFSFGFGGGLELTSEAPVIWFPIIGENKYTQIVKAHNKINPQEICPLLPFPSKNPRRSDNLIISYHKLFFDELRIEAQNILYVHEQNPFEVYRCLSNAIINYNKTLSVIHGCKAAISAFSSKLLSIGALITAYEFNYGTLGNKIGVGILNVDSEGYRIEDLESIEEKNCETELFLTWLTGDPYN